MMASETTMARTAGATARRRPPRWAVVAVLATAVLAACGGGGGGGGDARSDGGSGSSSETGAGESSSAASSDEGPGDDIPVAPYNNPDIDDPDALGTRRAAVEPGQWFEFEYGYSARIESVRAAEPGEVETEATGGGASVINIQVRYDGDEETSEYVWFQLDTTLYNQASCADQGAGYHEITLRKGETVDVPYCAHLEDGGNGVALFSYPGSSQSWGAWYALIGPEGVIEPEAPPTTEERPGF